MQIDGKIKSGAEKLLTKMALSIRVAAEKNVRECPILKAIRCVNNS
jgi:hypothetical protein